MIKEGDVVHLIDTKGRRYRVLLKRGSSFSFHKGAVPHDDIIGKKEGGFVRSSKGEPLLVLKPTLADYILKMKRGAQIIYPKDIGVILVLADIFPGAKVLEAGTGSGALTMALLRAVGSGGKVISYENRREFMEIARSNIEGFFGKIGSEEWKQSGVGELILKEKDIYAGIEEEELDRILLDVAEPWRALKHVKKSLRNGGILLCYLPTILQVYKMERRLGREKVFMLREIHEVMMRRWEIRGRSMRPEQRMVAHTGFILVARKYEV
ncbi:MAG: tRNA (adenine-N1)-methyltransferase [Candidatus Methanospirareceae archaeon]